MTFAIDFNLRNYSILLAGLLVAAAAGSIFAATRPQMQSGIQTDYYRQGNAILPNSYVITQQVPNPYRWQFVGIAAACVAGVGVTLSSTVQVEGNKDRKPLIDLDTFRQDLPDTISKLSSVLQFSAALLMGEGLKLALLGSKKAGRVIHLRLLPGPIRNFADDVIADRTWVKKLLKRHVFFAVKTRGGKTTLTKFGIIQFVQEYPEGWLRICDPNYGKRGINGEEPNTWMDLPLEYISGADPDTGYDDIYAAIQAEFEDLQSRRKANAAYAQAKQQKKPKHILDQLRSAAICVPSLLVVDEWERVIAEAEDRGIDSIVLKQIHSILTEGLGYGKRLYILNQSAAVNATRLKLSKLDQMCRCLIQDAAEKTDQLTEIGVENVKETKARVRALRRKGHRVAVIDLGESDPRIQILPNLSYIDKISFVPKNEIHQWWNDYYVKNQSNQTWLQDCANRSVCGEKGVSPLSSNNRAELIKRFGGLKTENSDPRYSEYFRPTWNRLVENAKVSVVPQLV